MNKTDIQLIKELEVKSFRNWLGLETPIKKDKMSLPNYDRNFEIVKLRLQDPQKWTVRALQEKYKFKSPATVQEILDTFTPKYQALRTYPQKKEK